MKKSLLILSIITAAALLGSWGCSKSKKADATPDVDPIASGIEMSQTLLQEGDPVNGIKTLEELNQRYPNQEEILEALAFAHINQNNHLEAAFYFESIAKLDSTQTNLFLQAAQSYEEEKEYSSALRCYNRYLEDHPADGQTWKSYAKILTKKQQYDHALQAYIRALSTENGKPTPVEVISIGKLFYKKGDLAQANDWYELGKTTAESRPYALLGQTEIRIVQNNFADGEALLNTLAQEYPAFKNQSPYLHLQKKLQTAKAKHEAHEAEQARIAAQKQAKAEAQARAIAATYIDTPAVTTSTPEATTAPVALDTANTQPNVIQTQAEPQTPQSHPPSQTPATTTEASTTPVASSTPPVASESHTSTPTSTLSETAVAAQQEHVNIIEKKKLATISSPTATPTTQSTDTATLLTQAEAAFQNQDMDEAIRLYWKIVEVQPKSEKSWLALSEAYFNKQDFSHAQATAQEAMRVNPKSEAAATYYVNILSQNKNHSEYFAEINKLKQQFPHSTPVALEIGKSYEEKLNNPRNAYYTYLQFLQNNPNHPQKLKIEAEANRLYAKLNPGSTSSATSAH